MKAAASVWVMPNRFESPKARQTVDDAEVDGLGHAALRFVHLVFGNAEDPRGDHAVDIVSLLESPAKRGSAE